MFNYNKYFDVCSSIHSIHDIINLFDLKEIMGLFENTELFDLDEESICSAIIYDAIYYSYITISLLNLDKESQTSFKLMCKQFYKQYILPTINEKKEWCSFFEVFIDLNNNGDDTERVLSANSYKQIKYVYNKLCKLASNSLVNAFGDKLKHDPRNAHVTSPPEFYDTILFYVFLYSNIQNNKKFSINIFEDLYCESVGLDSMKQKSDDTIFNYEVGWYLLNIIFNNVLNTICYSGSNYDWTCHPKKMMFTLQSLQGASHDIAEKMLDQEYYDAMVYIISLIILKSEYCYPEQYQNILSSIKSVIISKQAIAAYNINIHINAEELDLRQNRTNP